MAGDGKGSSRVCVTGASGFIGSWLVMRLLERGYYVRATVRNPSTTEKVKHLLELPKASTNLSLWKADLNQDASFDEAIQGCDAVFHVATSMDFVVKDPENEFIKPTIDGVLNVMRSCSKAKTVKRVVYTSTTGTIEIQPQSQSQNDPQFYYDECVWTDVDFCRSHKMFGWIYYVAKTEAEKAAWKYAKENEIDLITIQPSIVIGPYITPSRPGSIALALALITTFYPMLAYGHAVHLEDVCNAHIYLLEHPHAEGRYICSSLSFTLSDLANSLSKKYPEYDIDNKFEGFDDTLKPIPCSSKKLLDLGFKFKYNPNGYDAADLCAEAIEECKTKGHMPCVE